MFELNALGVYSIPKREKEARHGTRVCAINHQGGILWLARLGGHQRLPGVIVPARHIHLPSMRVGENDRHALAGIMSSGFFGGSGGSHQRGGQKHAVVVT